MCRIPRRPPIGDRPDHHLRVPQPPCHLMTRQAASRPRPSRSRRSGAAAPASSSRPRPCRSNGRRAETPANARSSSEQQPSDRAQPRRRASGPHHPAVHAPSRAAAPPGRTTPPTVRTAPPGRTTSPSTRPAAPQRPGPHHPADQAHSPVAAPPGRTSPPTKRREAAYPPPARARTQQRRPGRGAAAHRQPALAGPDGALPSPSGARARRRGRRRRRRRHPAAPRPLAGHRPSTRGPRPSLPARHPPP